MEKTNYCQSCGMPLNRKEDAGTNEDGSLNQEYCHYCYQNGVFTSDCTMEEMIEHCLPFLDEFNKENNVQFTKEQAVAEMKTFFPTLKRWSGLRTAALCGEIGNTVNEIITMEKSALERWNQGDPSGYLEIYSQHITYFDPFQDRRLDGLDKMEELYEGLRGKISADRYEMLHPVVEVTGNMAVLSYNLISYCGSECYKWNCTEVYKREGNEWKIVHNHWSFMNAGGGKSVKK